MIGFARTFAGEDDKATQKKIPGYLNVGVGRRRKQGGSAVVGRGEGGEINNDAIRGKLS